MFGSEYIVSDFNDGGLQRNLIIPYSIGTFCRAVNFSTDDFFQLFKNHLDSSIPILLVSLVVIVFFI